ncbi:Ribonuclease T2 [Lasiodiplodia theobromae]|uniref:ribonuclease T2 n=1 Tax=Lasiodiplodia theobromae TaxID=45133 RepID=A0A5N5DQ84_9PEZI|nr:Ribonuclease T2 [Lasiodiplodia theobromae]KAB2579963.1 Ribonuclease T2-like [Lasiodiplodia theobromae]KAF4540869.1 Ribonuclease T2 [Lasiodiplodia theobromae]
MQLFSASNAALLLPFSGMAMAALYNTSSLNHTCQLKDPILSCSAGAQPGLTDTCCTETFGGLVLATQFWDTYTGYEAEGQLLPEGSWTIHGLWPDFCNGSYTQYCDLSRQYDPEPSPNTTNGLANGTFVPPYNGSDISSFLTPFGKYDLLEYMNTYWIAQNQPNWYLWAHEFSKHATCFSTFDIPCYGPTYAPHADVVDFFETAILFDRRLPTYDWLADAAITPSNSTSYTLSDIQGALAKAYGATPYVGCSGPRFNETAAGAGSLDNGRTRLSETWYYSHVVGRPQEGVYVPVNTTGSGTSCAKTEGAVWYYERTPSSERAV